MSLSSFFIKVNVDSLIIFTEHIKVADFGIRTYLYKKKSQAVAPRYLGWMSYGVTYTLSGCFYSHDMKIRGKLHWIAPRSSIFKERIGRWTGPYTSIKMHIFCFICVITKKMKTWKILEIIWSWLWWFKGPHKGILRLGLTDMTERRPEKTWWRCRSNLTRLTMAGNMH